MKQVAFFIRGTFNSNDTNKNQEKKIVSEKKQLDENKIRNLNKDKKKYDKEV